MNIQTYTYKAKYRKKEEAEEYGHNRSNKTVYRLWSNDCMNAPPSPSDLERDRIYSILQNRKLSFLREQGFTRRDVTTLTVDRSHEARKLNEQQR